MNRYQAESLLAGVGTVLMIGGLVGVLLLLFATAMVHQDVRRIRNERIAREIQWIKDHSK